MLIPAILPANGLAALALLLMLPLLLLGSLLLPARSRLLLRRRRCPGPLELGRESVAAVGFASSRGVMSGPGEEDDTDNATTSAASKATIAQLTRSVTSAALAPFPALLFLFPSEIRVSQC